MKVSVIGLGKLGSVFAACLARAGNDVIGIDALDEVIRCFSNQIPPVDESGLQELLFRIHEGGGSFEVTKSLKVAAQGEIIFVFVPTPSRIDGSFSSDIVCEVCSVLAGEIRNLGQKRIVVIKSTVMPESCRREIWPLFKGVEYLVSLIYNPDFSALGELVKQMMNPSFLLLGSENDGYSEAVEKYWRFYESEFLGKSVARFTMVWENAELAKLCFNMISTMKISFANKMGELCERIRGGDVDKISEILMFDNRITCGFFTGGLGYGGPCFPRDDRAFRKFCVDKGVPESLSEAVQEINNYTWDRLYRLIYCRLKAGEIKEPIGFIGLTYKQGSSYERQSQVMKILKNLKRVGVKVLGYDPDCFGNQRPFVDILGDDVYFNKPKGFLLRARTLVVSKQFKKITQSSFRGRYIFDLWRKYTPEGTAGYFAIGRSNEKDVV